MPILEIEIVTPDGQGLPPELAGQIANAAQEVLRVPPGRTWVKLFPLPRSHYAESGGGPSEGVLPVFIKLLKAPSMDPDTRADEAARLTQAMAQVCARPAENIHILYLTPGQGRASFGGRLLLPSGDLAEET